MINAYLSDKYKKRGAGVIVMCLLAIIGYGRQSAEAVCQLAPSADIAPTVFLGSTDRWIRYGSLFFSIVGIYGTAPA